MIEQGNDTFTLTLPSDREIVMTRIFDAPREIVFEAHSKPEHVRRWWGLRNSTMPICEIDFRPGGAWRFVTREPDGSEYAFRGKYLEIVAPEKLVQTFEFEGMPGIISIETTTFEEHDGKTKLINTTLYETVEARDGMVQSGMEGGARETWDRLAELVESNA
jgi:uncharacterized protein YndB with AHSA1/START domain